MNPSPARASADDHAPTLAEAPDMRYTRTRRSVAPPDDVRFARPRFLPGVELVATRYRNRSFPEHSHGEYVVGAVVAGAEALIVRGRSHVVRTGEVLLLHPGEAHANRTIGDAALEYQVLYLPAASIRRFMEGHGGERPLQLRASVERCHALFDCVTATHAALAAAEEDVLDQETAMADLVQALAGCTSSRDDRRLPPQCSAAVAIARAYVDAHHAEAFGLGALADLTGISVFHLVRSFKNAVGLSPLAYRNQRRIMEARGRLLAGQPIAELALDLGYADQSHFTRQFQRIIGTSPGRYARQ